MLIPRQRLTQMLVLAGLTIGQCAAHAVPFVAALNFLPGQAGARNATDNNVAPVGTNKDLDLALGSIRFTVGAPLALPAGAGAATFSGSLLGTIGKPGPLYATFPGISLLSDVVIKAGPAGFETGPAGIILASLNYYRSLDLGLSSITSISTGFSATLKAADPQGKLQGGERFGLAAVATTFTSQPGDLAKSFWIDPGDTNLENQVQITPNTSPTELTGVYKPGQGVFYLLANIKLGAGEEIDFGPSFARPCNQDTCEPFISMVPEPSSLALVSLGLLGVPNLRRKRITCYLNRLCFGPCGP